MYMYISCMHVFIVIVTTLHNMLYTCICLAIRKDISTACKWPSHNWQQ